MHFFYLDESGCTGKDLKNQEQPIFVLGGISVRDEGWNETQQLLASIINQYFEGSVPEDFELHAEQLLSPDGDGPFSGHSRLRRNALAKQVLGLLPDRKHDVHIYTIDKKKLDSKSCDIALCYDIMTPYLLAYDYLITYINHYTKELLGQSARGMIIIDVKEQFHSDIEQITQDRRFHGPATHRVKWIVEYSYPVNSRKNPMVQLSDLVVFCTKKFFEIEGGYRDDYSTEVKQFYAECYSVIHDRIRRKALVKREGRDMQALNNFLSEVQAILSRQWKRKYAFH